MALDLILANERIVSRSRVWRILDAMEIQHLHASGGWKLLAVACRESMPGRGPTEIAGYSSFSLVRRGTFCVHRGALTTVADPLTLLEFRTGEEYRVSHPLGAATTASNSPVLTRRWTNCAQEAVAAPVPRPPGASATWNAGPGKERHR